MSEYTRQQVNIRKTDKPTKVKVANGVVENCLLTEKIPVIVQQRDTHTLLGLDWFRQSKCTLECDTGKLCFPKEEIYVCKTNDETENNNYPIRIAEVDEEELNEFTSW